MNTKFRLTGIACIIAILMGHLAAFAQSQSPPDNILLEMIFEACGSACDRDVIRVYTDGRYVQQSVYREKGKSGRTRIVSTKTEELLDHTEMAELIGWAEQSDFINALSEYPVKIVRDGPAHITIVYRNKGREKKVLVANYNAGTADEKAKVPRSVLSLMRWAQPYLFQ
jgi:hypothetical protein